MRCSSSRRARRAARARRRRLGPHPRPAHVRSGGDRCGVGAAAARLLRSVDHARIRPGPQRRTLGQLRRHGGHPAQASRSRAPARLQQLRGIRARHPHGAHASRKCCSSCTSCRATRAAAQQEFAELRGVRRAQASRPGTWASTPSGCSARAIAVSQEELRPYFPLPRVLAGLFEVAERLFGVRIRERAGRAGVASGCALLRDRERRGQPVGSFYLDAVRPAQQAQRRVDGRVRRPQAPGLRAPALPVAYLVCNFLPAERGPAGAAHTR